MKRSLLIATGILTAILVLSAGAAQLAWKPAPHCDLTGLVSCSDATLDDDTLRFSLTSTQTLTNVRVAVQSSCGPTEDHFIPEIDGPLTVEIACPGGVSVAHGDLTVLFDNSGERGAVSGSFATH